uniref:Uncharacterized protein n=1 Tax=Solibacter usitatus (strain Ellin6076) TaxID=234267 RepID=Q021V9_SOLUE
MRNGGRRTSAFLAQFIAAQGFGFDWLRGRRQSQPSRSLQRHTFFPRFLALSIQPFRRTLAARIGRAMLASSVHLGQAPGPNSHFTWPPSRYAAANRPRRRPLGNSFLPLGFLADGFLTDR